jgi:hypothetical protein
MRSKEDVISHVLRAGASASVGAPIMPVMESWLLTHLTTFEVILTGAGSVMLGAILLFGGVILLLERRKDGDPRELRK